MEPLLFFPAETRKFVDHGFMQAYLSFKPELEGTRKRFGALVTIDDGTLQPDAKGFGIHGHQDTEVVTFMLEGEVKHVDPQVPAHTGTLTAKGIQIITAGTGIVHNEENYSQTSSMRALQIWFTPRKKSLEPNYDRKSLDPADYTNRLQLVLSPDGSSDSLIVQQDAYMSYGNYKKSKNFSYQPKLKANHTFIYIIDGKMSVLGQELSKGDGFGLRDNRKFSLDILESCEFLILDVPPL